MARFEHHKTLLCGHVDEGIYVALKNAMGYQLNGIAAGGRLIEANHQSRIDGDNVYRTIYPITECLDGLWSFSSAIPVQFLSHKPDNEEIDQVSRNSQLTNWVRDLNPRAACLLNSEDPAANLGYIFRLVASRNKMTRQNLKLFWFQFRKGDNRLNDTRSMLTSLLTIAALYGLQRTPQRQRSPHVLEAFREPRELSHQSLFNLFEDVNIWLAQEKLQVIWAIGSIEECTDNLGSLVGGLLGSCKFSDVRPFFLFAGLNMNETCDIMGTFDIVQIKLPRVEVSMGSQNKASSDLALRQTQPNSSKVPPFHDNVVLEIPDDPALRIILSRRIHSSATIGPAIRWTSNMETAFDGLSSTAPQKLFETIIKSLTEQQRKWAIKVLRWVSYSICPLSPSNITDAMRLEINVSTAGNDPRNREAPVDVPQDMITSIRVWLPCLISIENNELSLRHEEIRDTFSLFKCMGEADSHLHILQRLLHYLSLKAVTSTVVASNSESPSVPAFRADFTWYAVQFWPEHYKKAKIEKGTKDLAQSSLKRFLINANEKAVSFWLDATRIPGSSTRFTWTENRKLAQIAVLARCGLNVGEIGLLLYSPGWSSNPGLVFPALLEAARCSHHGLIGELPLSTLKKPDILEVVLAAAAGEDIETMLLIFRQAKGRVKIPQYVLLQAARLGITEIITTVFREKGTMQQPNYDHILRESVVSRQNEITALLIQSEDIHFNELEGIMREACRIGDPNQIRILCRLEKLPMQAENCFDYIHTACAHGNHLATKMLLEKLSVMFPHRILSHIRAIESLSISVRMGWVKCTEAILHHTDVEKHEAELYTALYEAVDAAQMKICEILLRTKLPYINRPVGLSILLKAVANHDLELVKLLVKHGIDINACDGDGKTPLYMAAYTGLKEIAGFLLDNDANIDCRLANGETPLYAACIKNEPETAEMLLRRGADLLLSTKSRNWSPLEAAYDFPEIVKLLVNNKPRPDFKRRSVLSSYRNGYVTALFLAAKENHLESARWLLTGDPEIDFSPPSGSGEYSGYTSLATAAAQGHTAIVRLLLEKGGANVNHLILGNLPILHTVTSEDTLAALLEYNIDLELKSPDRSTVLNFRARDSNPMVSESFLNRLLNAGANIEAADYWGDTPLMSTAAAGNRGCLKFFVSRGANVNSEGGVFGRPIHRAARTGCLANVKTLVANGADLRYCHNLVGTPLQSACAADDNGEALRYFVERGAKVDAEGGVHQTVVSQACLMSKLTDLEYLLDHGGSATAVNRVGMPLVLSACFRAVDTWEAINQLTSRGAKISAEVTDRMGRTVLHCAAVNSKIDLLERLIKQEPDLLSRKDNDGWTALHWATRKACPLDPSRYRISLVSDDDQADAIRFLLANGCPGLETVLKMHGRQWTVLSLARYHRASEKVINVILAHMDQESVSRDMHRARTGNIYGEWSCDGCYCVGRSAPNLTVAANGKTTAGDRNVLHL